MKFDLYPKTHKSSPVIQALDPGEVLISVEIWFLQLKHWAWTEYCPKNILPFTINKVEMIFYYDRKMFLNMFNEKVYHHFLFYSYLGEFQFLDCTFCEALLLTTTNVILWYGLMDYVHSTISPAIDFSPKLFK